MWRSILLAATLILGGCESSAAWLWNHPDKKYATEDGLPLVMAKGEKGWWVYRDVVFAVGDDRIRRKRASEKAVQKVTGCPNTEAEFVEGIVQVKTYCD